MSRAEQVATSTKRKTQKAMTRGEARKFRARWKLVNAAEERELQLTSLELKLDWQL
jgi:hypothetical protein